VSLGGNCCLDDDQVWAVAVGDRSRIVGTSIGNDDDVELIPGQTLGRPTQDLGRGETGATLS
jgi:hypothetical protein